MIVDENGTPVERFLNDVRLVEDHYYSVRNDKVQRTFALNEDRLEERRSISAHKGWRRRIMCPMMRLSHHNKLVRQPHFIVIAKLSRGYLTNQLNRL